MLSMSELRIRDWDERRTRLLCGVGLQLWRLRQRCLFRSHAFGVSDSAGFSCRSHGAVSIKHHTLCYNQPGARDITEQSRGRNQLYLFLRDHVSFHLATYDDGLSREFCPDLRAFADRQCTAATNLAFDAAIDSGRAVKRKLTRDTATLVKEAD